MKFGHNDAGFRSNVKQPHGGSTASGSAAVRTRCADRCEDQCWTPSDVLFDCHEETFRTTLSQHAQTVLCFLLRTANVGKLNSVIRPDLNDLIKPFSPAHNASMSTTMHCVSVCVYTHSHSMFVWMLMWLCMSTTRWHGRRHAEQVLRTVGRTERRCAL